MSRPGVGPPSDVWFKRWANSRRLDTSGSMSQSSKVTPRSHAIMARRRSTFWSFVDPPPKLAVDYLQNVGGGYKGPGIDKPRKYVRGELRDACRHPGGCSDGGDEYRLACKSIGAEPNSFVEGMLKVPAGTVLEPSEFLGGEWISLRNTYIGERGFIALLPVLDRNTAWTSLDASNNGLRNEAVLHLVDLTLRPHHTDRVLHLDLSKNPISDGAGWAILELCRLHPHIGDVNLQQTRVNKRLLLQIRRTLSQRHMDNTQVCRHCGNVFMADSRFCRRCGMRRLETREGSDDSRSTSPLSLGVQSPSMAEDQRGRIGGGDDLGAPGTGRGSLLSTPLECGDLVEAEAKAAGDPLVAGRPERVGSPREEVQELGSR